MNGFHLMLFGMPCVLAALPLILRPGRWLSGYALCVGPLLMWVTLHVNASMRSPDYDGGAGDFIVVGMLALLDIGFLGGLLLRLICDLAWIVSRDVSRGLAAAGNPLQAGAQQPDSRRCP
ncbi:hypothetical protein [Montanilutibacter psychrotolerans]|uniref:Uncharacterized protein n=1 Tax=Montanilutibacter psychrotolerans TaxID=1327343 RepID=A0A3M8T6V8_9GAMM|nr:hypothetical protein [Lysobacter psychrotolerans]RNF86382.1 hypothetical protein EER27_02900 [Lysobacter psychrotolerans]